MALDGLEGLLRRTFPKNPYRGPRAKVNLVRYADDFIITGCSKELLTDQVRPLVEQFLRARGLELSQEKTQITHIEDGFDFLGQHVQRYNGKIIIKPSKSSVHALLVKVRDILKANKQTPAGKLIRALNPIIRGWVNYHRHVVSKKTFSSIDHAITGALWQWARRRHPRKFHRWIKDKYFRVVGGNRWVFYGEHEGAQLTLIRAASVSIKRHIKIKGEANPFDPQWEVYFEHRLGVKMAATLRGRRQLLRLWKEQNGICPVCNQKITEISGWHNHHIIWRSRGGPDAAENRVLLHPNCHRQIHSQGTYVEKPRPERGE